MKTRRDYHKQTQRTHANHLRQGIGYSATCETCQRAQLGELANNPFRLAPAFGPIWVNLYGEFDNAVIRKQPHYRGCE